MAGKEYSEQFYVFDKLNHALILGRTFLNEHGAVLDFSKHTASLLKPYRVHAIQKLRIVQHESCLVAAQITDRFQRTDFPTGLTGVVSTDTDSILCLQETAVSVSNNQVPLFLVN